MLWKFVCKSLDYFIANNEKRGNTFALLAYTDSKNTNSWNVGICWL
jgi:hypothetical protein